MLKDWVEVELGEVLLLSSEKHKPETIENLFYIGLEHIEKDTGRLTIDVAESNINTIKNKFYTNQILYGKLRPYLNKVYLATQSGVCSTDILVFNVSEAIYSKYAFHYMLSRQFVNDMSANTSGVNLPRVSTKYINSYKFPLAPLSEQRAIATKIEQLFSELDNGIANLKTAKSKLEIYRQAILKQAFEGGLTKDWRKKQPKNHGNHVNQKNHSTDNLPETWKWVKLEDLAIVGTGATPKRGDSNYWLNGSIAWITSGALNDLYVKEASEFITEAAIKETNCKIFPKGSLLIAMYGEGKTRGKCSELMISAATNQAIASIEINDKFKEYKKYIKWFLLKNYDDIRMLSSGGVQPNLNLTIVKNTKLPFCPIEEQTQIVQEIETRLSVCDKLNEAIEQSLEKAQALRQSILKKAFEGKLLSEDELRLNY